MKRESLAFGMCYPLHDNCDFEFQEEFKTKVGPVSWTLLSFITRNVNKRSVPFLRKKETLIRSLCCPSICQDLLSQERLEISSWNSNRILR